MTVSYIVSKQLVSYNKEKKQSIHLGSIKSALVCEIICIRDQLSKPKAFLSQRLANI